MLHKINVHDFITIEVNSSTIIYVVDCDTNICHNNSHLKKIKSLLEEVI